MRYVLFLIMIIINQKWDLNLDYLFLEDMSFDLSFIFSYDANVLKFGEGYAVAASTTQPEGSSTGEGSQFNPD